MSVRGRILDGVAGAGLKSLCFEVDEVEARSDFRPDHVKIQNYFSLALQSKFKLTHLKRII